MPIPITIAGRTFATKEAFIEHCQVILHREEPDTDISGDDANFVEAVLFARPDKVAELSGRRVVRYLRKMHRHNTPCFFAELEDSTLLDFSYMKFVNAYPAKTTAF